MKSILDPTFVYVPAAHSDIRKTFRRLRKEQREAEERERNKRTDVVAIKRVKGR